MVSRFTTTSHTAFCFTIALAIAIATPLCAQQSDRLRPADTSSPRATLQSFIESCNEVHRLIEKQRYVDRDDPDTRYLARRILDCVDDSDLPQYARKFAAAEAAICIKEVLDRVELPPYDEIPNDEEIEGMEEGLERWRIPGTRLTIVRIDEGSRKHEYVFSAGTVARSFEYFEDMRGLPYRTSGPEVSKNFYEWFVTAPASPKIGWVIDSLPEWVNSRALDLAYWKWAGLALAIVLALALMAALYQLQRRIARRYVLDRPGWYFATLIFPALALLVPKLFQYAVVNLIALRGQWLYVVAFATNIVALLAVVVLVFAIVNRVAALFISAPHINPQGLDAQFIRILSKIIGLSLAVLVFLEGGKYLGIPITTLLASAGVGGLAMALAAQDTLRNLFGTIMLMADKPFRVGERIVADGYDGIVEDIGLRSTRIRLLTGHLVTIPNDTLARNDIENIGRRPYIRRVTDIRIPLKTSRDKIDKALTAIRQALADHEGMSADYPPRVFFNEFNADSFNVRVIYWYPPARLLAVPRLQRAGQSRDCADI